MKSVNTMAGGVRHLIRNGKSTRVREDLWAGHDKIGFEDQLKLSNVKPTKVAELLDQSNE